MSRLVTRSISLQAIRASTFCANRLRARRLRPIKTLYLWKAVSTSARLPCRFSSWFFGVLPDMREP
jgi:hypothetical protein